MVRKMLRRLYNILYFTFTFLGWKIYGQDYLFEKLFFAPKNVALKILNITFAKVGTNVDFESNTLFHNIENLFHKKLLIGNNTHIGKNCFFDLKAGIIIEDNVTISMQTTFITHVDFGKSELVNKYPKDKKFIRIGENSYIGAKSTILMGVELGKNCIVAAGSVVINSFPPNTLIGGVPAKIIKQI